jgi:transposase-like protein
LARGVVQRCHWHKRETVVRYLPPPHQRGIRRKLQSVRREVALLNLSAASSLDEGLEETLTLHRLDCFRTVGASLKTTNILESIHARVASRTDKVDHWKTSEQKQRWVATALLDLEPRLHRINHFEALPKLQQALTRVIRTAMKGQAA